MAVAGNADPMLGYLTTSFREHPHLRGLSGGRITTAMSTRLAALGAPVDGDAGAHATASLYAAYVKAGGDRRTTDALRAEGVAKIENLRARGYDVGCGHDAGYAAPPAVDAPPGGDLRAGPARAVRQAGQPRAAGRRPATRERPERVAGPGGLPGPSAIRRIGSRRRCAADRLGRRIARFAAPADADGHLGRAQRQRAERESARGPAAAAAASSPPPACTSAIPTWSFRTGACAPAITSARSSTRTPSST